MSFSLTTRQFIERTKTVTRRLGWTMLKPGDRVMGCEKVMGRKKGEPLVRLGEIEIVGVRHERLADITVRDVQREGFFGKYIGAEDGVVMRPADFVAMFCRSHKGCTPETIVTRIEFRYV